tara:strand:- start:364 stop:594 length:231 start_codon:yes stop_codon:yes gene_type:complete
MKTQGIPVVNYDIPPFLSEKDLEDLRLNKIERPKLTRQSARSYSEEELKMSYKQYNFSFNEKNKKEIFNLKIKQNS